MDIGRLRAIITANDQDFRAKMRAADQLGASTAAKIKSSFSGLSLGGGGLGKGLLSDLSSVAGGNLISGAIQTALGGVTGALQAGMSAGINYNKMLELAGVSFTTLLGSTARAQAHLEELRKFGESTPFEFPDLIKGSQRMQAMGFSASAVIPTLRAVGDAVSAVGGGKEELDGVVLALGQMKSKGTVSAEEMNQLAERGIPAWDILAQKIGKTTEETRKLGESGRLRGAPAVDALLEGFTERFGGQMDKMSATLAGRESNFQDILNRQLGTATAGSFEELKKGYEKATIGLSTTGAAVFATELDKLLTEQARALQGSLEKIASGEYFRQGAQVLGAVGSGNVAAGKGNAITAGQRAAEELRQGNVLDALIGKPGERGPKVEAGGLGDQGLNWLKKKFESLGSEAAKSFGTGMATGTAGAQAAGAAVGGAAEEGVRDSLQQRSPSRVMLALGAEAAQSFFDSFAIVLEAGKKKVSKSPIDVEAVQQRLVEDLRRLRDDPKVRALLDVIAMAEGANYNTLFGGASFSDFSAHPNTPVTKKLGGKNLTSTAAGRYQFLNKTWQGVAAQTGLKDFSPESQDLGAILLMKQRGMLGPLMSGDVSGALTAGNREWASLPGSPYGQPTKKAEDLIAQYNAVLERLTAAVAPAVPAMQTFTQGVQQLATVTANSLPAIQSWAAGLPSVRGASVGAAAAPAEAARPASLPLMDHSRMTEVFAEKLRQLPAVIAPAPPAIERLTAKIENHAERIIITTEKYGKASERLEGFKEQLGQGFDDLIFALAEGGGRWKDAARRMATDIFNTLASEFMLAATGGQHDSLGKLLGSSLGSLFKGAFGDKTAGAGFRTPDFNPNAGSASTGNPIVNGLKKVAEKVTEGTAKVADKVLETGNKSFDQLSKLATSNAAMAACGCPADIAPAPGRSGIGSILGSIIGAVGAGFAGGGGGGGGELTGISFEEFAAGGAVRAGILGKWNEPGNQGELFVPAGNGYILNRAQATAAVGDAMAGGGGRVNNITINVPVSAPAGTVSAATRQQIAAQTAQSLQFALARNG